MERLIDREKVIKGLELCAGTNEDAWETQSTCDLDCPYAGKGCVDNLMLDALALIDTQHKLILELQKLISAGTKMMNGGEA